MQRLIVVGTAGSGKTTLAMKVAEKLGYPFFELDALFWKPNWVQEEKELFRQKVSAALQAERWTAGGNYSVARDIIWQRADTLVWLDYPLPLVMSRLLRRTLKRVITQEYLWAGNRETWRNTFLSKDSLLLFALQSHWRHRRKFPIELQRDEYRHLQVYRLQRQNKQKHGYGEYKRLSDYERHRLCHHADR